MTGRRALARAGGSLSGAAARHTLPDWSGRAVAIVGAGPSATAEALAAVRGLPAVAVNRAVALVPDADVMVSIDANWPPEGDGFQGLRVVGVPGVPGHYTGIRYERVRLAAGEVIEIRNNTLTAMRIAAQAGAKRLVLVGIDPERYEAAHGFRGFALGLAALVEELRAAGVEVVAGTPKAKPPVVVDGMQPLGDSVHQRAIVRAIAEWADVWLRTPWPQLYRDLGVRLLPSRTSMRTGARNEAASSRLYSSEQPPDHAQNLAIWYTPQLVMEKGGVVQAMAAATGVDVPGDFRLAPPADARERLAALGLPDDRPIMVYKPLTGRYEWGGTMARDPDPAAYAALADAIRERFFVVSLADLHPGKEWIVGSGEPAADLELHGGELDLDGLMALFARASLVFSAPGFAVPLAHALGTPAVTVFGGFEDARSFSWGARTSRWLPILPVKPCPCWTASHGCDKRIDLVDARARLEKFVAKL